MMKLRRSCWQSTSLLHPAAALRRRRAGQSRPLQLTAPQGHRQPHAAARRRSRAQGPCPHQPEALRVQHAPAGSAAGAQQPRLAWARQAAAGRQALARLQQKLQHKLHPARGAGKAQAAAGGASGDDALTAGKIAALHRQQSSAGGTATSQPRPVPPPFARSRPQPTHSQAALLLSPAGEEARSVGCTSLLCSDVLCCSAGCPWGSAPAAGVSARPAASVW